MEVENKHGEILVLYQNDTGLWCCPICGSPELDSAPYYENGSPSFQMCSCDFEYGFDDDPMASGNAVEGVKNNWDLWRNKLLSSLSNKSEEYQKIKSDLKKIGIEI